MMPGRLAYRLYQGFWSGLDWLYPPECGGCGKRGRRWCSACAQNVEWIRPPYCPVCGQKKATQALCRQCQKGLPVFAALRSCAVFKEGIRTALHKLKYRRDVALGEILARLMLQCVVENGWDIDLVIPVPLGLARFSERGYNQASLLALPLGLGLSVPYRSQVLFRVRETRSQVGLSATMRRENVEGAFQARPADIRGKHVLLVDDVTTSGATMNACSAALLEAGASLVYGITLARAPYDGSVSTLAV